MSGALWKPVDSSYQRVEGIDVAYAYCIEHDRWPEGFNPFNAIRDLLFDIHGYRRALVAHHEIATLSEEVLKEYDYRSCPICARAQLFAAVEPLEEQT